VTGAAIPGVHVSLNNAVALERAARPSLRSWGDEEAKLIEYKRWEGEIGNSRHLTRKEVVRIPVAALLDLSAVRGERRVFYRDAQAKLERFGNYTLERWQRFVEELCSDGMEEPVTLTVDFGQQPKIYEGNHRIQAAAQRDWQTICAEIKYYGRAETLFKDESFFGQVMAARPQPRSMPKRCEDGLLSRQELIERGASGHLLQAVLRYVRLDKIEALPAIPARASEAGASYKWGRQIVDPIEVTYVAAEDRYFVYAGRQRLTQARINEQSYVLAFVEPDQGRIGEDAAMVQPRGAYPRMGSIPPWNDYQMHSAMFQERRVEEHVNSYLLQGLEDEFEEAVRVADWRRSIADDCEAFVSYRRELIRRWPHIAREVGAFCSARGREHAMVPVDATKAAVSGGPEP